METLNPSFDYHGTNAWEVISYTLSSLTQPGTDRPSTLPNGLEGHDWNQLVGGFPMADGIGYPLPGSAQVGGSAFRRDRRTATPQIRTETWR